MEERPPPHPDGPDHDPRDRYVPESESEYGFGYWEVHDGPEADAEADRARAGPSVAAHIEQDGTIVPDE